MPLVGVPENLHNPAPGIRFLRISGQMRMRIAKSRSHPVRSLRLRDRSQEYEDKKELQSDRPDDKAWSYGGLEY
jgi:hypothetical protein